MLWSSFEEALSLLDSDTLRDDNSCYLLGYGDENWRDSAHHDYQYMIGDSLKFASDIPKYLSEWICSIKTEVKPKISLDIINNNCIFLNFNYTDTLEASYNISRNNILYIHGKALEKDNLVIGHNDNTLFRKDENHEFGDEEDILYYDDIRIIEAEQIINSYFEQPYKDTDLIISQNSKFFNSLYEVTEIYILGHSLSDIDLSYFYKIKMMVDLECKWYISYYKNKENAKDFVSELEIQNFELIKIDDLK